MRVKKAIIRDPVAVKCLIWHMRAMALAHRLTNVAGLGLGEVRADKLEREAALLRRHAHVQSAVV